MPEYDYRCENCRNAFTVRHSIAEHEKKEKKHQVRCPKCDSAKVRRVIQSVFVTTSRKS